VLHRVALESRCQRRRQSSRSSNPQPLFHDHDFSASSLSAGPLQNQGTKRAPRTCTQWQRAHRSGRINNHDKFGSLVFFLVFLFLLLLLALHFFHFL
jgi:hypothetical protein